MGVMAAFDAKVASQNNLKCSMKHKCKRTGASVNKMHAEFKIYLHNRQKTCEGFYVAAHNNNALGASQGEPVELKESAASYLQGSSPFYTNG